MTPAPMRILRAQLAAPRDAIDALARFYGDRLGLPVEASGGRVAVGVGAAELAFAPAGDATRPFYHFALLVPGDRFDDAHGWIGERVDLLSRDGETVIEFDFWNARACYFHDPAHNIVELIAHLGEEEQGDGRAAFAGGDLLGISELGIVSRSPARTVERLGRELSLELWSGEVDDAGGLGFVGRKAHTLIVAGEGRGWMPTGRPAEAHPVDVMLGGGRDASVELPERGADVTVRTSAG